MNKSEMVLIRPYTEDDRNFIFSTFLIGLHYGNAMYAEVPKNIFMHNHHKIIEYILSNPETEVRMACLKESPTVLLGYSITGPKKIHWVYIKPKFRGIGIAKDLIPPGIEFVTHLSKIGLSICKKKGFDYNPYDV